MADKSGKSQSKSKHRMMPRRSLDVMPPGQATPTTRPIIPGSEPGHTDTTVNSEPALTIMSHRPSKSIEPIAKPAFSLKELDTATDETPTASVSPVPSIAPAAAVVSPAVPTPATPGQVTPLVIGPVASPAFPGLTDNKLLPVVVTPTEQKASLTEQPAANENAKTPDTSAHVVPEIMPPPSQPDSPAGILQRPTAAPGLLDTQTPSQEDTVEEGEELDLSTLTGVHGAVVSKPDSEITGESKPAAPPTEPPSTVVQQTPKQAVKLAAALRDLKHHPAPPPNSRPIVVVHQHDYLRTFGTFGVFVIIGLCIAAIAFDLLVDSGVLQVPVEVPTNFFK